MTILPPPPFRPELHPEIPPPPALPRIIAEEPALSRGVAAAMASLVALCALYLVLTCGWGVGLLATIIAASCARFLWWLT